MAGEPGNQARLFVGCCAYSYLKYFKAGSTTMENFIHKFVGLFASLTKALAVEWARFGVCVNALVPGVLRTEMNTAPLDGTDGGREFLLRTPMHRFRQRDELAEATVFLASDAASFVTGHLLVVDGGILASGVNQ